MQRPAAHEYQPAYATYVDKVPTGDIVHLLEMQVDHSLGLIKQLSHDQTLFRYAPGKWSVKEVLGHMTDTERIMSYRLLCAARGDSTTLPGFDENEYVRGASFDQQKLQDLLEGFALGRRSTLALLRGLTEEAWHRSIMVNKNTVTVSALAYIIAGHELHHMQIVKERYLPAMAGNP